ncbi:MAG: type IV pilus secretin PilQ [Proteobacteria bacterium]|nr:type IV pilus secretin PilQ [Pseudomonadota bacterium]
MIYAHTRTWITSTRRLLGSLLFLSMVPATTLLANTIEDVTFTTLPGEKVQIRLKMAQPASEPTSFTIDNPARIALDFPGTNIGTPKKSQNINVGVVRSISGVEAGGRSRVVINLAKPVGYTTTVKGDEVFIDIGDTATSQYVSTPPLVAPSGPVQADTAINILDVDFQRGMKGEGRILVTLADPNTPVEVKKRGKQVVVTLKNSSLSEKLERRLDVIDFATPVTTIDSFNHGNDVRLIITAATDFDYISYQANEKLAIDIKPPVKQDEDAAKKRNKFPYSGERLSLNFQNIEVRAVLQLLADFTGLNMVVSDTVSGNLTLRLKNVPWDQALDIVLKTKGLAKRVSGNVMLIAPAEEIAAREKLELEAAKQVDELAPLINETIQVNYAKASDLATLIKSKDESVLSPRGSVSVDQRTNKLLVRDTSENIDAIIALVEELDIAVRQVLIESRVVLASDKFTQELGVRFGVSTTSSTGSGQATTSGSLTSADGFNQFGTTPQLPQRLNVDLPAVTAGAGSIGLAIAKLPFGTLLDLELSAAQAEGKSETISSPKVITANQQEALIETGTEIPYQEATSSGATSVAFKKAVLSLKVTPQITPDDRVIMDLVVTKDKPNFANQVLGVPPIDTNNVETQVLVDNGETVVLGGVYETTKTHNTERVPFFGDLPLVGVLFRHKLEQNEKTELLIFVTPKLIKENIAL